MRSRPSPALTGQATRILTVQQVADLLQIPKSSIYEKTRARPNTTPPLPCHRVGKYLRFDENAVMQWFLGLPQNKSVQRKRAA